jgi:hypothetical protein
VLDIVFDSGGGQGAHGGGRHLVVCVVGLTSVNMVLVGLVVVVVDTATQVHHGHRVPVLVVTSWDPEVHKLAHGGIGQ